MTNLEFVVAAYSVILGGIALYAAALTRRIRIAREARARLDGDADEAR
jgi:hypothetical protein